MNFGGYFFLPGFLMILFGAVNVLTSQTLAFFFLKEYITSVNVLGTLSICLGVMLVITMTPRAEGGTQSLSFDGFVHRMMDPLPLVLLCTLVIMSLLVGALLWKIQRLMDRPHLGGDEQLRFSGTLCALVIYAFSGTLSVITTKGVAVLLREAIGQGKTHFANAVAYLIFPWWVLIIGGQVFLVNYMLSHAQVPLIVPLMYSGYTLCGTIGSGIYYREFGSHTFEQLVLTLVGIAMLIFGVYAVTRRFDRLKGFWPWCCPQYQRPETRTAAALELDKVRNQFFETSSASSCTGSVTFSMPSTPRSELGDDDDEFHPVLPTEENTPATNDGFHSVGI